MGKILKFGPRPPQEGVESSVSLDVVQKIYASMGMPIDQAYKLGRHLNTLQGPSWEKAKRANLPNLSQLTTGELRVIIDVSSELLWNQRPGYYAAVFQLYVDKLHAEKELAQSDRPNQSEPAQRLTLHKE